MMPLSQQIIALFILAIPIASVAWTVTHEEIFREPRDWCTQKSKTCKRLLERKLFYLVTCEFCFSHYVTAAFLFLTRYKLLYADWRGYLIAGFSLVWIANIYMSIFGRLRLEIKLERVEIEEVMHEGTPPRSGNDPKTG
jgi:uncharacterized membrane protein